MEEPNQSDKIPEWVCVKVIKNFIGLNNPVEKDPHELSNMGDIMRATMSSEIFKVVYCKEAFYHVKIEEKDKHKTAFKFNKKVYEWNNMVLSFKNSSQIFQKTMNKIFEYLPGCGVKHIWMIL